MLIGKASIYAQLASAQNSFSSQDRSGTNFVNRLEKHLDDVSKGRGYLSKEVGAELSDQNRANNELLSKQDPRQLAKYAAYSTAFTYSNKARYVHNSNDAFVAVDRIRTAHQQGADFEKTILEKYGESAEKTAQPVGSPETNS